MQRIENDPAANLVLVGDQGRNVAGFNTDVDTAVEDIWDGGGLWVAPTAARTHQIASSDAGDDGDPVGVGARTIRIWGLTSWTAAEVTEDIELNGVTDVPTVNDYVIINRMKVLTHGTTSINVGNITATADTDSTVTAQILAGIGESRMAVYGVPTGKTALLTNLWASILLAVDAMVDVTLLCNPDPATDELKFASGVPIPLNQSVLPYVQRVFNPYQKFDGPCILKVQAISDTVNADVSAGFDLIVAG